MYDYLIVGAGLFGSVFACEAKKKGKKVLVIEARPHVGGNLYTEEIEGIQVHKYGAHIFHTNDPEVWAYISNYAQFQHFINTPVADYKGERYALPFNMYTFQKMWGITTPEEAKAIIEEQRKECMGVPKNLEEQAISLVGRDIYEKLIKGYTKKQWGRDCKELPAWLIKRVPVRFTYDNNYYDALYQGIPVGGYTKMIKRLLDGVEVRLETDFLKERERWSKAADKIIYTGMMDAFFKYRYGALAYRSLHWEEEVLDMADFQGNAVVNYTDQETAWTRIVEHKWFTFGKDEMGRELSKTVISREYSMEWKPGAEPYYPVNDEKNTLLYLKYKELAKQMKNVVFAGRLGEYRYYDMDQTVAAALRLAKEML